MVRVDNKQDSDQQHYYSQYWIDVAMGKSGAPVASAPSEVEEEEELDDLGFAPQEVVKPKPSKVVEKKPDAAHSTLTSLADLANIDMLMKNSAEMDDTMMPDITAGLNDTAGAEAGYDTALADAEPEAAADEADEGFYEEEEDEEDDEWGGPRRKKAGKPKRHERRTDF